jgi:hypothetical protein
MADKKPQLNGLLHKNIQVRFPPRPGLSPELQQPPTFTGIVTHVNGETAALKMHNGETVVFSISAALITVLHPVR